MQKDRAIGFNFFRFENGASFCSGQRFGLDLRRFMLLGGLALLVGSVAAPRVRAAVAVAENGPEAVAYHSDELVETDQEVDVALDCLCKADVNKDGEVTQADVDLVQDCFSNIPGAFCDNADVDCDDAINISDIIATICVLGLPPTEPPEQCCGKVDPVCIYSVACIDGSCSGCGINNPGLLCEGAACPGGTCASFYSSTCGADCCLEMVWTGQCELPSGLPACPQENNPCPCDSTEGACCNADGTCAEGPESKCTGQYQGDGSVCGGDGPCCIGGACVTMDSLCCAKLGGVPKPCVVGATCCIADSDCPSEKCKPGFCDDTSTCDLEPKQAGCCTSNAQCPETKCRRGICDLASNGCTLGPKDPGCCETDAQCDFLSTKCRRGVCEPATNGCVLGDKEPGCCETDDQCPGTKCRAGFCDFLDNVCVLGPKAPGCCESDDQCGKCGICFLLANQCLTIAGCCETDADCPGKCDICDPVDNVCVKGIPGCCDSDDQCRKCELCDFSNNTCFQAFPGCCETDADCTGKCDICDPLDNVCVKGIPGCCDSDAQCADIGTKCRTGFCDFSQNLCRLSGKAPGCCETDTQCPGTKCRQGFCDFGTNTCFLGIKAPGCCEGDAQCPSTKCRQGFCALTTNTCFLGDKLPGCCESDAQCPPDPKCQDSFCDLTSNTCRLSGKFPGCCTTDAQCPPDPKCHDSFCNLITNSCEVSGKFPGCCTTDDQCPSTKCRQGFCALTNNTCFLGDKDPGCCETDTQCPGTKCRIGFCDFDTNTCELTDKLPGCCEGDAQCPSTKCRQGFCVLSTNTCELTDKLPGCCEGDAQCPSTKCRQGFCVFNLCLLGPKAPGCCETNSQCPSTKCRQGFCDSTTNTCDLGPKSLNCCETDGQCPSSKCRTGFCDLTTNTCDLSDKAPNCCETDAQCPSSKCRTGFCDLTTNLCVLGPKFPGCCTSDAQCPPGDFCDLTTNECVKAPLFAKWSQRPGDNGEDVPSNLDWPDFAPNVVVADDWVSDGRVITAVRWWGSRLKEVDPKVCPGPEGSVCGDPLLDCVCTSRIDGSLNCADSASLANATDLCQDDSQCVSPAKCFGTPGALGVCAVNCGDTPPDPKVCAGPEGAICGDATQNCVCASRIDGSLNCADAASIANATDLCQDDSQCTTPAKCFGDPGALGVCAFNCGDAPPDPKVCDGKGIPCGDPNLDCVCVTRFDGTLNCADALDFSTGQHGFCPNGDAECPTGTKCFVHTPPGFEPVCAHNCGEHPFGPKVCDPAGDNPFCTAAWSKCGSAADECHCGRHAPLGQTVGVGGVCLDKDQFANGCTDLINCAGEGDQFCDAQAPGSKCVFDECCQWVCAFNCGEVPPPDPKVCEPAGDSPFCNPAWSKCGNAGDECHCGRHAPLGQTIGVGGVCLDKNQFANGCADMINCAGEGDPFCDALDPGSKCVFDECCQWVCAHNCGEVPDPKLCPILGADCGIAGVNCICSERIDGSQNCVDVDNLALCDFPCVSDFDCDATNGIKCFVDPTGVNPGCCSRNCSEAPQPKVCDPPGVCGTFTACGDPLLPCICATRVDGTGACHENIDCAIALPCLGGDIDCSTLPGDAKCFVDTCCGVPICGYNCGEGFGGLTSVSPYRLSSAGSQLISIDGGIDTAQSVISTGAGIAAVTRTPSVNAGDISIDTPQAVGDPDGWFLSFHQPLSKGTVLDRPLAVYFCDVDAVEIVSTTLPACDGHPVIEYFAYLDNCCLVHENGDTRYDPPLPVAFKDGFHEQQCDDYHLDIQAVVGTKFFQDPDTLECIESKTGRTADADFWGWHTSPRVCGKGQFGPNTALTGEVTMGVAIGEWLYGPWENATTVCSEANMAFELLTPETLTDPDKEDGNGNCVPDKCECPPINPPTIPAVVTHAAQEKNRYFSIVPNNPGKLTALRVTLASSSTFPNDVGKQWWIGAPREVCENSGQGLGIPPALCGPAPGIPKRTMWSSELTCLQTCLDWHSLVDVAGNVLDMLHVGDPDIVTGSVYTIEAVDCSCDKSDPANFSTPLAWGTSRWGDVSAVLPSDCPRSPPDTSVDLVLDVIAVLGKFSNNFCAVIKSRADLEPQNPDRLINITDVFQCLNAFSGLPYPFSGPVGCP